MNSLEIENLSLISKSMHDDILLFVVQRHNRDINMPKISDLLQFLCIHPESNFSIAQITGRSFSVSVKLPGTVADILMEKVKSEQE